MLRYVDPRKISDKHIIDHPNLPDFVDSLKKSIKIKGQMTPLKCFLDRDQNMHLASGFYLRRALMQLRMRAFTYIDEQLFFKDTDLFEHIFECYSLTTPSSIHLWPLE